jgi:integrase/recombinase XerD
MPYQYKREPLSDDEVNRLTNTFDAFGEKFVIWTLLGTDLMVSSLGGL